MKLNTTVLALFFAIISCSPALRANKWVEASKIGDVSALNFHLLLHGHANALKHLSQIRETAIAHAQFRVLAWLDETFLTLPNQEQTTWEELGFDTTEYQEPLPFHVISPIPQDPYAWEPSDDEDAYYWEPSDGMEVDEDLERVRMDAFSATDSSF